MTFLAVALALSAGALFGLSVQIQKVALGHIDEMTGTFVSVATTAALFWIAAPFAIDWGWWLHPGVIVFLACGLIFPAMGQRLQIASVQRVGPALTSAMGSFTPVFAVVPALLFLGERMTWQGAAGLTLMIGGLLTAALGPRAFRNGWTWMALFLPLGAALVRGIIQPVTKAGYGAIPSPIFASLVMASVSTLVIGALTLRARRRQPAAPLPLPGRGLRRFAFGGVLNGLGILSLLEALRLGDVTVIAPISSATPLWTIVFGALMFRNEQLVRRHALVAVLVVLGAALIVTR